MSKLKLFAVVFFTIPAMVYFLLWVLIFATTFRSQERLFLELVDLYTRVLSKKLPIELPRDRYLFDVCLDFAVHSSIITWLAVLVFIVN
jgi:hypothetical protein